MILKDLAIIGYNKNEGVQQIGIDSYHVDGLFIKLCKGLKTKDFNKVNIILLETEAKSLNGYPIRFGVPFNISGIIDIYIKFDYEKYFILNRRERQVVLWNIISETFTKYLLPKILDNVTVKDILKRGRVKIEAGEI